jgi:hypothetical protein
MPAGRVTLCSTADFAARVVAAATTLVAARLGGGSLTAGDQVGTRPVDSEVPAFASSPEGNMVAAEGRACEGGGEARCALADDNASEAPTATMRSLAALVLDESVQLRGQWTSGMVNVLEEGSGHDGSIVAVLSRNSACKAMTFGLLGAAIAGGGCDGGCWGLLGAVMARGTAGLSDSAARVSVVVSTAWPKCASSVAIISVAMASVVSAAAVVMATKSGDLEGAAVSAHFFGWGSGVAAEAWDGNGDTGAAGGGTVLT